ncbi:MAG: hypothetical protein HY718_15935 [Planctomycetes bacterium]|nr:hypothetical protein [Planctomycetota bacterium]
MSRSRVVLVQTTCWIGLSLLGGQSPAIAADAVPRPTTIPAAGRPATTTSPAGNNPTAAPLTTPGTDRIELAAGSGQPEQTCWVYRPPGYGPGQRPPLIVCLHGTDDTADQMIEFWRARRMRIPAVIAAPQGIGQGWCSDDVPAIRAMFDELPDRVWYDPHRVLLAGFSAGGAMTFQLLYGENVPVTAAAALANYVPPRLTAEEIRRRRDTPVFYAVGMADVNHELMRSGLDFLRSAGANVELYHPSIGHVLSPGVAQAAVDWFYDQSSRQTAAAIDQAALSAEPGPAADRMERIVAQPRWHEPQHVARAGQVLRDLEAPGEASLRAANEMVAAGQAAAAVETLRGIEQTYGIGRLGVAARQRREQLESDPVVRQQIAQLGARRRSDEAMAEYAKAQKLVADRRLSDAAEACRRITTVYGDTPAAERAYSLLKILEGRTTP